jgi:hypothetical protein
MLDVRYLFVNFCVKFVGRSSGVLEFCDGHKLCPEILLLVFFLPELFVDFFRNFFGLGIFVNLDAINCFFDSFGTVDYSVSCSGGFVEEKSPLDLILAFFVPWRGGLIRHIPAMIINITGVTSRVCRLRITVCKTCIFKSMSDQKILMRILKILVEISSHIFGMVP